MTPAETEQQAEEEAFGRVFHGMPPQTEREKMSPENLALELAKHQSGSPAYIILSHELNLRLAKEQAKATLSAGRYGGNAAVLAAILTAILGFLLGSSQAKEPHKADASPRTTCNCTYPVAPLVAPTEGNAAKHPNGKVNPKP